MKHKEQSISVNTLFAASIACFIKTVLAIYLLLSPFIALGIIQNFFGKEAAINYMNAFSIQAMPDPILLVIWTIFLLACAILFLLAAKHIKKNKKIVMWSILTLIISFLLLHFDRGQTAFVTSLLGIIGSISGLIYKETK